MEQQDFIRKRKKNISVCVSRHSVKPTPSDPKLNVFFKVNKNTQLLHFTFLEISSHPLLYHLLNTYSSSSSPSFHHPPPSSPFSHPFFTLINQPFNLLIFSQSSYFLFIQQNNIFLSQLLYNSMTSSFFSDLLNSPTDQNLKDTERSHHQVLSDQNRLGLPPKFKSTPPPSLPLSPTPLFSPSSYFSIPPGFSLSELLDSPVLLNSSHVSLITNSTSCYKNNSSNHQIDHLNYTL